MFTHMFTPTKGFQAFSRSLKVFKVFMGFHFTVWFTGLMTKELLPDITYIWSWNLRKTSWKHPPSQPSEQIFGCSKENMSNCFLITDGFKLSEKFCLLIQIVCYCQVSVILGKRKMGKSEKHDSTSYMLLI